ncbi:PilT protein domain protein [Alkalidesulfovibrio alkalitolerans DSM 16529]|jgi:predicted nucleic acid-binding protein|uniref:PilT protein domain protein n=1 Tax=Alkalidesulfovibrio alkalitolerans DSM 16529 TaxID=1121439 RepID=S7TDQ5_9BACT|nr:type II toxin-antitoxin system VapC family toxin [Alkalidesulfovibrio alkalitolerans]EPR34801.1 PilT protein domain protein [Alkalidesulfovibrio alkalitolerans DSM 16529]
MSAFVADCSLAMAWCFEDEASAAADELLARTVRHGIVVPSLWRLEVANVLLGATRKGRLTLADARAFLGQLDNLPIHEDEGTGRQAFGETMALAAAHGLTSYDAAYLELAMRGGLPLATRDRALIRAGRNVGLELLGC